MARWIGGGRQHRLVVGAALSFALFTALAQVTVPSRPGVDAETRALVRLTRGPGLDAPMQAVTLLGQAAGLVPLIAVTSLLLWRGRRRWALLLPVVMAGTGAVQMAAKWAVDRPRPNLAPWGYPSGHVLSLVVFLGALVYLAQSARIGRRRRRAGVALAGATLAAVAFSRLYLDVHWLSDLGGGFSLGMAYLLFVIWLVEVLPAWRARSAMVATGSIQPSGGGLPGDAGSVAA